MIHTNEHTAGFDKLKLFILNIICYRMAKWYHCVCGHEKSCDHHGNGVDYTQFGSKMTAFSLESGQF